ncbi:MAG: oligosaccharide flippase family protein [Lachnospiraceae bacterium]|nr:oligosaccharide flippase family protein [Lachnospiraceae bacterium]
MDYIYKIKDNIRTLLHTGFGHIFIANVINQIISFISGFILIRVLTKSDYGIYSYAFNIYSFIALANGFGIESACLQVCSENRNDRMKCNSYMRFGFLFGSFFNVFLAIIIIVMSKFFHFSIDGTADIFILFACLPFLTTVFNLVQTYFRYNLLNAEYSKNSIVNTVLILLGSVFGAFLFQAAGLIIFREIAMLISVCVGIYFFRLPLKEIMKSAKIALEEKKDVFKIAAISMLNIATGQLLYLIDVFLIGLMISDALVVASYKTATIIPNALLFIPTSLAVYIYPYFAEKQEDKQWVKQKFYSILKYFAPFNALISIGLIIFAPFIIQILFGEQYLDAVPAFRILSLSYFFSATFRKIIGNLLVTQRKLKVNFWLGITESVLNIISNTILIYFCGAIGAAITTLLICIVSSAISMIYFIRYLNKNIC